MIAGGPAFARVQGGHDGRGRGSWFWALCRRAWRVWLADVAARGELRGGAAVVPYDANIYGESVNICNAETGFRV